MNICSFLFCSVVGFAGVCVDTSLRRLCVNCLFGEKLVCVPIVEGGVTVMVGS